LQGVLVKFQTVHYTHNASDGGIITALRVWSPGDCFERDEWLKGEWWCCRETESENYLTIASCILLTIETVHVLLVTSIYVT
jgi:hypothetical protein